jgi:hypothetical protein
LLLVACLAVINSAFAQKDAKTDPRFEKFMDKVAASKGVSEVPKQERPTANHFYKSYQDFVNNNPAPGILLSKGRTEVMGKASYGVDRNGTIEKLSVKELSTQYWGFCDQYGVLYRLTEKDAYLVIISGKITQYVRAGQCTGTLNKDSTFTLLFGMNGQGGYLDYASKGVNGEIVELDANLKNGKSKALEQMMSDHPEVYQRLLADEDQEKYIKDKYRKRENLTFKLQHYIREYNTL